MMKLAGGTSACATGQGGPDRCPRRGCGSRFLLALWFTVLIGSGVQGGSSEAMSVSDGLADWQLYQRDWRTDGPPAGKGVRRGSTVIRCEGEVAVDGPVWGRVLSESGGSEPVIAWQRAGRASGGRWSARVESVPTGGPYIIELAVGDSAEEPAATLTARHVLVGDLWILAGQSNMQGFAKMQDVEEPSACVVAYGMNERWCRAEEPLHWLNESSDPVHHPGRSPAAMANAQTRSRTERELGAGLGLAFGKTLYELTDVPVGLVPCAHGGTSMAQWDPSSKDRGGRSLYGSMLRRFHAVGGQVRGVLWYQGESDVPRRDAVGYRRDLDKLVRAMRRDFRDAALPLCMAQLSRTTLPHFDELAWSAVREQQRIYPTLQSRVWTMSTIDLELDDPIHVGTHGLKRLGRRMARVMAGEVYGVGDIEPGPRLERVEKVVRRGRPQIRVVFSGVNGALKPPRHIAGFTLRTRDNLKGPPFYEVRVAPDRPNTLLCMVHALPDTPLYLWYGYGANPYCNLVDEADMAVKAFGPVEIRAADAQEEPPAD